ncbi:MAG: peptidoglycan DD-metalloendopeptidase family protein [Anaerolinea sp.]|nr:peptidoglycan DD-metalloendopeptidase family protein [Anaerolinea sp.]
MIALMGHISQRFWLNLIIMGLFVVLLTPLTLSAAQPQADCGIVDAIDYPIDGISIDHDDFGMYRAGFQGYHTGIDMAFGRYGEPVRAAAKGRVTYADPAGWNDEKGVVIIEHLFPDRNIYFTLYGHMEEVGDYRFPMVGQCVSLGDIIGAVGNPKASARHLHYETRTMRSSAGGPGYWETDPLNGGWMHPIEFTEQWRLRLSPAFRKIVSASGRPGGAPLIGADGSVVFVGQNQIESVDPNNVALWRLSVPGLMGIVALPDGRILGRTSQNQVILFANGRFAASWVADRPLHSPPLRLNDVVAFISADQRIVGYSSEGQLQWQTDPLSSHIEEYAVSSGLLAISGQKEGAHRLWVVNDQGKLVYEGTAPAPVIPLASPYGLLVLVGSQVGLITPEGSLMLLLDTGQSLGRSSRAAMDNRGNVYLYPGQGDFLFAYGPDGGLRWQTRLAALPKQPPLIAVGQGCLMYALTDSGALLSYQTSDGALRGIAALYAGGTAQVPSARLLEVLPSEQVRFSAGYVSIATLDGLTLAGLENCPN